MVCDFNLLINFDLITIEEDNNSREYIQSKSRELSEYLTKAGVYATIINKPVLIDDRIISWITKISSADTEKKDYFQYIFKKALKTDLFSRYKITTEAYIESLEYR